MSKYRIPLVVDYASKKVNSSSGKYRLPFKKDEPVEEREFTLTKIPNEGLMVTSQVKLPQISTNTDPYRTSKLEITPVSNISLPQQSKREQIRQASEMGKESNRQKSQAAKSARNKEKAEEIASDRLYRQKEISQLDEVKEIIHENQKGDSKLTRSKAAISQYGKKRRRYLSTASKYADDEGTNADYSETDFDYKESRKKPKEEKEKEKEALPTIGERLKKKTEAEEEDEEPVRLNIWDSLSKDIAEYREAKRRQEIVRKKSKNKRKFSRSISKRHKSSNEVEIIEDELKRLNQDSSRQLLRKDLYEQVEPNQEEEFAVALPGIKKDSKKQNEAATHFIERLKSAIEFKKEKPKKGKQKLPLQFYINSYEQIRQINPFFRKINQLGGCILLSIGKLTVYQPDKYIYNEGDILKNVYIIIYGKVFLNNKHKTLKKFALTGETLGQQQLFEQPKSYIERLQQGYKTQYYRQDARTLNKCCLLTISLKKYYKMYRQLQKMGYKQLFNLIDNLFRINYINKQANQHHQTRERMPTEILIQRPNRKHSFFH